jgi:chemotaxis protein CheY-P-specific phosphatase CheC
MQPDESKHAAMVETFQESLDTMAFVPLDPAEPDAQPAGKSLLVTMDFNGPLCGQVALVVPESFAHTLAANFLGTEPNDPETDTKAADSIKELVNVTVGAMMPKIAASRDDMFDLSIPQSRAFDTESEWKRFTGTPNTTVFSAEGETIAIQLCLAA